ncbi:MAG: hypothetical protein ACPH3C_07135, partial [Glaciecola sp.]
MKEIAYRLLNSAFVAIAYWWIHEQTIDSIHFFFEHLELFVTTSISLMCSDVTTSADFSNQLASYFSTYG